MAKILLITDNDTNRRWLSEKIPCLVHVQRNAKNVEFVIQVPTAPNSY